MTSRKNEQRTFELILQAIQGVNFELHKVPREEKEH